LLFPFFLVMLFAIILMPIESGKEAPAQPTPWADEYGFWYPDGHTTFYHVDKNTPGGGSLSYYHNGFWPFSGIETLFEPGYPQHPSTHKSLCMKAWPATQYGNKNCTVAYNNLPGNALFVFMGHGDRRCLYFYNDTYGYTYLLDSYNFNDIANYPSTRRYVKNISWQQLHDLRFAMLQGCLTASEAWGPDNISTAFFSRGVDTVLGFTGYASYSIEFYPFGRFYPQHIWNQEFWRYSQIYSNNIRQSAENATYWVLQHTKLYYGWNAWKIYGKDWEYIDRPLFGD